MSSEGSAFDLAMVQAWRSAANDLGVRVIAPYLVQLTGNRTALVEAFVLDFGSREGALAVSIGNPLTDTRDLPVWSSRLYESYRIYDRQHFVDTLDDWGWFGASEPPSWYSGKPWTSWLS